MPNPTKKVDLSEHTLDINPRKYSVDNLDIVELDDFIQQLAGSRDYEYRAIRQIMIYLWGGSYESIVDLAEENWATKEVIRDRFHGSKERFLRTLPLPRKLSGVCHMATGTGKSYVIFAVAYLSLLLGKVDRVLVLTPSSTIIKKGLREKFHEYMFGDRGLALQEHLPDRYRHRVIKIIKRNDPPEDDAIMIENINGVYQYFQDPDQNSIAGFFKGTDEVLVLSDEVHHAYSQLNFTNQGISYDFDSLNLFGRQTEAEEQRRWMKFIREAEHEKIKRHIGFTGTPYNQDDFFTDVIFNYSIRRAIDEKYIKDIDPILKYDQEINKTQRYEQIIQTHYQNKRKFSYVRDGVPQVKPITVFICSTQKSAQKNTEEFTKVLADYLQSNVPEYSELPHSVVEVEARNKVICVVSKTKNEVEEPFNNVEELNPEKPGGKVEYIFSVQMLTEGWDVDNVFQIVPMEERAFNSKLLISQVLGRGLRVPRQITLAEVLQNYPILTVTNHESFSRQIEELLNQVTQSELRFSSRVFKNPNYLRYKHHFDLFNLHYIPSNRVVERDEEEYTQSTTPRQLNLNPQEERLDIQVTYQKGDRRFDLSKEMYTVDQVVAQINQRFKSHVFEREHFDFGDGFSLDRVPGWEEIDQVIRSAMDKADIQGEKLTKENKLIVELFFNQFLPRGKKKVIRENVEGNLFGIKTLDMQKSSASAGGLDNFTSIFVSEEYRRELTDDNLANLEDVKKIAEDRRKNQPEEQAGLFEKRYDFNEDYIRQLIPDKNIFVVNQSMFRTPQDMVIVSHEPERQFVFKLIENSRLIDAWVKSPDQGFYSLDYTFWKRGKDRTVRSFNPDFFIKLNLESYLPQIDKNTLKLRSLQDKGIKDIILVVEIKGDIEMDAQVARAKEGAGEDHFDVLSKRLMQENPINVDEEFRPSLRQHYEFFLLHSNDYQRWFKNLRTGNIIDVDY
jgi:type III restriction enzyme